MLRNELDHLLQIPLPGPHTRDTFCIQRRTPMVIHPITLRAPHEARNGDPTGRHCTRVVPKVPIDGGKDTRRSVRGRANALDDMAIESICFEPMLRRQ